LFFLNFKQLFLRRVVQDALSYPDHRFSKNRLAERFAPSIG
jgi:hypothetical protein